MPSAFKKGRPKKDDAERRDHWLPPIRLTETELGTIRQQADQLGLKPQQYARAKLLESPLYLPQFRKLPADVQQTLTGLLKLSGLLLHLSHRVADDDLYAERIRHSALELSDIVARSRAFVRERLTDYAGEVHRQRAVGQLHDVVQNVETTSATADEKMDLISQLQEVITHLDT